MIWKTLQKRIYNPYSAIIQTAVLQGNSGRLYPGVRIENLSFPLTMEAVTVAFCSCLSEGDIPSRLFVPEKPDRMTENWCAEFGIGCSIGDPPGADFFEPLIPNDSMGPYALLQQNIVNAHVPNSGFKVCALLETETGYIAGVNVETQNWSNGLCAERVAIGKAISSGYNKFGAIHIFAPNAEFISPCGACRQVIIEHLHHQSVKLYHNDEEISEYYSTHLLPFHFNSNWLKTPKS